MKKLILFVVLLLTTYFLSAQVEKAEELGKKQLNWHLKDPQKDKIMGTSVDRVYKELIKDMKPKKTVVVAVIDGGIDIFHDDIKGKVWINEKEIAGNEIDDDNNGFIDDIHGWNYIGNSKGENIVNENLEYTRIVKKGDTLYKDYKRAKQMYDKKLAEYQEEKEAIDNFESMINKAKAIILQNTGIEVNGEKDLKKVKPKVEIVKIAKDYLTEKYKAGYSEEWLKNIKDNTNKYLDYYLNLEHNPRDIVGDNPFDFRDRNYGNNDVKGQRADHGTPVAGVIAAIRNNNLGINGVTDNVKIMALRTTPGGDERDKDVALAIIYAVDNGADIINMSFGKQFSPEKEFVDEAVRYAEKHNVLMIHSAGNSGLNTDIDVSYPNNYYLDGTQPSNWLTVAASDMKADKTLAARFTNYGKKNVDIFAPGVDIASLSVDNKYDKHDGTSFSAPVASGVAALILSYYPELTPPQLISLLKESAYKFSKPLQVIVPGTSFSKNEMISFEELSSSGGIINAYNAFKLAGEKYGK